MESQSEIEESPPIDPYLKTSLPSWYKKFEKITVKSHFIPLEKDFIEFLKEDAIQFDGGFIDDYIDDNDYHENDANEHINHDEKESNEVKTHKDTTHKDTINQIETNEKDTNEVATNKDDNKIKMDGLESQEGAPSKYVMEGKNVSEEENVQTVKKLCFPTLQEAIINIIDKFSRLGFFPKLNWSSPKDACYMTSYNTVRCDCIEELFRMLKASDFIAFDIRKCEELGIPPVLCIRKYYDMRLSTEFRCFVRRGHLIGISQRDMTNFYSFLSADKNIYRDEIVQFFNENIRNQFELSDYVFDIYKSRENRWWIIDFNIWGLPTHPGLFEEWSTLEKVASKYFEDATSETTVSSEAREIPFIDSKNHVVSTESRIEFRIIDRQPLLQPSFQMYSGFPTDLANVNNFNEFISELQRRRQNGEI